MLFLMPGSVEIWVPSTTAETVVESRQERVLGCAVGR